MWVKTNAGMGSLYRSQRQLIFVFKSGTGRHTNNVELGKHGRNGNGQGDRGIGERKSMTRRQHPENMTAIVYE